VPAKNLKQIADAAGFDIGAFLFVQRGLEFTVKRIHGEEPRRPDPDVDADGEEIPSSRHVSGRQLCMGLRDFAKREYGLLARSVLTRWRVQRSEDFGRIVFAMVDAGLMHKTADDRLEDFADVFSFDEAFSEHLLLGENA
jgi:uncharacterized repeat protein (TIGR04138 family)